ncbi:MAG: hypothetical protein BWK78_02565 [Thiotrichaceae bacterium IS1]|nr:MAG: hypothetical protein BWK78_02565 [Thiotrichaceae bacterium IS1]
MRKSNLWAPMLWCQLMLILIPSAALAEEIRYIGSLSYSSSCFQVVDSARKRVDKEVIVGTRLDQGEEVTSTCANVGPGSVGIETSQVSTTWDNFLSSVNVRYKQLFEKYPFFLDKLGSMGKGETCALPMWEETPKTEQFIVPTTKIHFGLAENCNAEKPQSVELYESPKCSPEYKGPTSYPANKIGWEVAGWGVKGYKMTDVVLKDIRFIEGSCYKVKMIWADTSKNKEIVLKVVPESELTKGLSKELPYHFLAIQLVENKGKQWALEAYQRVTGKTDVNAWQVRAWISNLPKLE